VKRTITLALAAGLALVPAATAQARPVVDDIVYEHDLGPDKSDWYCTYQVSVDAVTCAWAPGNGETAGKYLIPQCTTRWWNPWTWGC
jgi:hypothetical protein